MRILSLFFSLFVCGCVAPEPASHTDLAQGDPTKGCIPGLPPELTVGKGEWEFEPTAENERKSILIHGLQGRFHTFVSLRGAYFSLDEDWQITIEGIIEGEVWATATLEREARCTEDERWAEANGTWLRWLGKTPQDLHDRDTTVRATVTDSLGRSVTNEAIHRIWDPFMVEEE